MLQLSTGLSLYKKGFTWQVEGRVCLDENLFLNHPVASGRSSKNPEARRVTSANAGSEK